MKKGILKFFLSLLESKPTPPVGVAVQTCMVLASTHLHQDRLLLLACRQVPGALLQAKA